jgi:hypothetical protein
MKTLLLLCCFMLALNANAQEEAYFISSAHGGLIRLDMETDQVVKHYTFTDSVVIESTPAAHASTDLLLQLNEMPDRTSFMIESPLGSSHPRTGQWHDSLWVNDRWHRWHFIRTDDGFVGGSPNRVTVAVWVETLGLIYSTSNWIDDHTLLMFCHSNARQQQLLTAVYKQLAQFHVPVFEADWLEGIIALTEMYTFANVVDALEAKWFAPRDAIVLVDAHTEVIDGRLYHLATIKNISNTGYYFLSNTYVGPAMLERTIDGQRVRTRIDGGYHGAQQHFNFERLPQDLYLNPGQEWHIKLEPNGSENWGTSPENTYHGLQMHRYGIDFFYWLFATPVNNYTLFHLHEIR